MPRGAFQRTIALRDAQRDAKIELGQIEALVDRTGVLEAGLIDENQAVDALVPIGESRQRAFDEALVQERRQAVLFGQAAAQSQRQLASTANIDTEQKKTRTKFEEINKTNESITSKAKWAKIKTYLTIAGFVVVVLLILFLFLYFFLKPSKTSVVVVTPTATPTPTPSVSLKPARGKT